MAKIKNLVISGGGVSGIGFLGIIKYLDEQKLIGNIETYVGTSIGSIICLLLLIDYKYNEIYDFCISFNLEKLIDCMDIDNFLENYGFESSNKIMYVIKRLLENKNISENITFNELYNHIKKKLTVTGVCLNDNNLCYFNYEKTPNMKVLIAICISSNIPVLFTPFQYENKLWLDGGLIQNYPIDYCSDDIENTLGISVYDKCLNKCVKIDDFVSFIINLMKCVAYGNNNLDVFKYKNNTIKLFRDCKNFVNFNIKSDDIKEIYDSGYQCAKEQHNIIEKFINNHDINKKAETDSNSDKNIDSDSKIIKKEESDSNLIKKEEILDPQNPVA